MIYFSCLKTKFILELNIIQEELRKIIMSYLKSNIKLRAHRNHSQVIFNDQFKQRSENIETRAPCMKSSISYKNHSTISDLLTDKQPFTQLTQEVHYKNNIQTIDRKYSVPKRCRTSNAIRQNKFCQFFQKNNQKFTKPSLQNTQFSDIVSKNQLLLRRGQFDAPIMKNYYSTGFKKLSNASSKFVNSKTTNFNRSKYTKYKTNNYFCSSILQCNKIRKQSQKYFAIKNHKDPFKVSITQHAQKYQQLMNKQRQKQDDKILKNSMNRMLVIQAIQDKLGSSSNFNSYSYGLNKR